MLTLIALFCLISPFSAYYILTVYSGPTKRKQKLPTTSTTSTNNVIEETSPSPGNLPPPRQAPVEPPLPVIKPTQVLPSNLGYSAQSRLVDSMDFSNTNDILNVQEFQAVILAGYGNSLSPLTNDHKDTASPKALLPIGNKPMITFPLTWLEEAGVTNVLLICPYSHRSSIAHHIHSDISSSWFSTLRIDIQTYEDDDAPVGTCAILRRFANRIQSDFIILPCDFIPPPNLLLSTVLNRYRANPNQLVISTLFFEVPVDEEKNSEDSQASPLIAYDADSKTLLHVDYSTALEADELDLHMRLLWKYPKLRIASRFADSHVYVCRRSILNLLALKPALESFREDLLPFLCKTQYRKGKRFRWEGVLTESANITNHVHSHSSRATSRASSAPVSPITKPKDAGKPDIQCGIEIHTLEEGLAGRANTLKSYGQLNRVLLKVGPRQTIENGTSQNIDAKAQISPECIIGSSVRISERTSIKQSLIGLHCIIGKQVRISDSIILDHVVLEDGAKIEGCILGRSTHIGAKAQLTKSVTQPGYEVDAGATIRGEKLETVEWDPRVEED